MVTQIVFNARLVREFRLDVLFMAWCLVHAIALGSFHLRLILFPHPCFIQVVQKHAWVLSIAFICAQSFPVQLYHFPLLGCSDNSKMPRRRGVSHHGGNNGNRGRASRSAPQNVIPIASSSPSSPPSGHARPFLHVVFIKHDPSHLPLKDTVILRLRGGGVG